MEQEDIITVIRLILSITKTIAEIIDEFDEMIMKSNESIWKHLLKGIDEINPAATAINQTFILLFENEKND